MLKAQRAGDTPIGVDVVEGKKPIIGVLAEKVQINHFVMVLIKVRNSNR